ncbi:N-acetylmuramoyl-L-alanine amidase [Nocardia wallacei]|uniref:N-acetylmuramoyl-L-alanine amidase n=1 Tax=Nocardia wallacei TaxID=480035 RepID=UPI002458B90F|nr:N-acetylmuramoyl-L-alanine amidase [Nocardia wallacei]
MKPSIVKAGLCLAVTAAALVPSAGMLPAVAVAAPTDPDMSTKLAGKTVFLDPGHQGSDHNQDISRPVGDGRGGTKECQTTGMTTVNGVPEHTITWNVSQLVKQSLEAMGAKVVLSRADDSGWGSCIDERAAAANDSGADVAISIHADGAPVSERGFHLIVPQLPIPDPTAHQVQSGAGLAATKVVRDAYLQAGFPTATYGGAVDGLQTRADIAGPALTRVPDVFLEMGNGANPEDAAQLESREGQLQHAVAIATGLTGYLLGFGGPPLPSGSAEGRASANTPPGQENSLPNSAPADALQGNAPGRSSTTAPADETPGNNQTAPGSAGTAGGAAAQSAPNGLAPTDQTAPGAPAPGTEQSPSAATPPGASAQTPPGAAAQSAPGADQPAPGVGATGTSVPGVNQSAPGVGAEGAAARSVPGAGQSVPGVGVEGVPARSVPGAGQSAPGVGAEGTSAQSVPGADQSAPGAGAPGVSAQSVPGAGQSASGVGAEGAAGPSTQGTGQVAPGASAEAGPEAGKGAPGVPAQGSGGAASGAGLPNAYAQNVPGSYTPGTPDAPGPGSPNAYTTPNARTSPDAYAPGAPSGTTPGNSGKAPQASPGTAQGSDPSTAVQPGATPDSAASSLVTTAMQLLLPLAKSLGMDDAAVNSELINLAYTLAATLLGPGSSESQGTGTTPGTQSAPGAHSGPAAR